VRARFLHPKAARDQTQQRLPRSRTRDGHASGRRLVARKEVRLLDTQRVSLSRVADGVLVVPGARPSFLLESLMHPARGTPCDVRNLGRRWRTERMEAELTPLVLDVHAVQSEGMNVHVESEG
jgi:hypothetical protein